MPSFTTPRGSRLGYTTLGDGAPLVCVPGGPLLRSDYLGDLGGLSQDAQLVLFDPPGSEGRTEDDDLAYRCDHVAEDVEVLRLHLGLERLTLLGHSAGANIVLRYAERHPERVERLLLITPSTRAVGVAVSDDARSAVARGRSDEPWYPEAASALGRIQAGGAAAGDRAAIAPFGYGRWDGVAVDHDARLDALRDPAVAALFGAEGAFDPSATRAALAVLEAPVGVIAGAVDLVLPASVLPELAGVFREVTVAVQPAAGHYPWIDDRAAFVELVRRALAAG